MAAVGADGVNDARCEHALAGSSKGTDEGPKRPGRCGSAAHLSNLCNLRTRLLPPPGTLQAGS